MLSLTRSRLGSRWKNRLRRRRLLLEGLEPRHLLAGDVMAGDAMAGDVVLDDSPWRNGALPWDASGDGLVAPLDFLIVANAIQRQIHRPEGSGDSSFQDSLFDGSASDSSASDGSAIQADQWLSISPGTFPDVNGDWQLTAIDALLVANQLLGVSTDLALADSPGPVDFNAFEFTGVSGSADLAGNMGPFLPAGGSPSGTPADDGTFHDDGTLRSDETLGGAGPFSDDGNLGGSFDSGEPGEPGEPSGPGESDSDGSGSDGSGSDGSGSDGSGGSDEPSCDTPTVTISAPTEINEYTIFTVSGIAQRAERIHLSATGNWALVDRVGSASGRMYNPTTGAYARMMIFKDDHAAGTVADRETLSVNVTGPCPGSASTSILVKNVAVTASSELQYSQVDEGQSTGLIVQYTDAVRDGHTVVVDWGDGQSDRIEYDDQPLPPDSIIDIMNFVQPPERQKFTDWFFHEYRDDNPSATPSDKYTITITVTDNDGSRVTQTLPIVVKNVAPTIILQPIQPRDNQLSNGLIDESEGFVVRGTITDVGTLDTHVAFAKADLNWDNDTDDPGERIPITKLVDFEVEFQAIDDGPSPGNQTSADLLRVTVEVIDDDTGKTSSTLTTEIMDAPPQVDWDGVTLTYTRDSEGDIDSVTVTGGFQDLGVPDRHHLKINWGDGGSGNGSTNPVPLQGRTFAVTRALPKTFGSSIRRIFPVVLELSDDDSLRDSGQIDGTTHWSFQQHAAVGATKDLPPRLIQPFAVPQFAGASWKGYGTATIPAVPEDSNSLSGVSKAASAVAYGGFNDDLHFRAASGLTYSVDCDRESGAITPQITGGGGTGAINLRADGAFVGWDPFRYDSPKNGPIAAATFAEITVTPTAGVKQVRVRSEAQFGISANVSIINEEGPQIEGIGGKFTIKRGTSSTFPSGYSDQAHLDTTYFCHEKLVLKTTDLED